MSKDNYQVGQFIWQLDLIPVAALSNPLTDAWDHVPCVCCDDVYYRIGAERHMKTHRYSKPLWLQLLKKMMK